jgi:Peptidase inhibitor family I36
VKRLAAFFVLIFAISAVAQNYPPPPPRPGPPPGSDPWLYGPGPQTWDPSWNRRPNPRRGACIYTSRNFTGNHFCVRAGDRLPRLPGNFGDNVSAIQVFGGARVQVFNDRNYSNGTTVIARSVADLRNVPFRNGHTWNNRISSVIVF